MSTKVVFRPDAEADITSIALYIALQSPSRASTLVARLRKRCAMLASHPLAGRARPELGEGLRSLAERPYVIIYRVTADAAEIVAILHGARDLPATLAKRATTDSP